jgi:circadian clock protein KaiB
VTEEIPGNSTEAFEKSLKDSQKKKYVLHLYVSGNTHRSARAILNLRNLLEEHLQGRYELEVIDIYQQPELARNNQILATPTLVKSLPLPIRKVIGDLSEISRILVSLDIVKVDE